MKTSRRHFLKIAGFSAMALASGLAAAGAAEAQIAPGRYVKRDGMLTAKRWAMVIDTRRFRTEADYAPCIEACQKAHNIPDIHDDRNVKWIWTDTFEHPR
jgi:molybdopterin-containing oxidoreductase family iron-sulfur binding subunit